MPVKRTSSFNTDSIADHQWKSSPDNHCSSHPCILFSEDARTC